MEAFSICVGGMASATQLLIHPSDIAPTELMDLFRKLAKNYELYYYRSSLASMIEVYKYHMTAQFTRLCTCAMKNDMELPPPRRDNT